MNLVIGDPSDYDKHEPLELEGLTLTADDAGQLVGIAIAANDCVFKGCDLSGMQFYGAKRTRFESCKLRGTLFSKHLRTVVFDSSQLVECTFRMMVLDGVDFDKSAIVDCDFYGSELKALTLQDSSFEGVGFDACSLEGVDLCGASQLLIGDPRTLKGAALCETQVHLIAARLAQLSGIDVRDC